MHRLLGVLVMTLGLVFAQALAARTLTSCSAVEQTGYVITNIQEQSSSCGGRSRYTFTELAGESLLESCSSKVPSGWVNSGIRTYNGRGECGNASPTTAKTIWQISNTYGQTKLVSCLQGGLPAGWVITQRTSYAGSGDCGQAGSRMKTRYEVQSTAGQPRMSVCSGSTVPAGWAVASTSSSSRCGSGSGNLWQIINNAAPALVDLHRYGNAKTAEKVYVTRRDDSAMAASGYSYETIAARVPGKAVFGTTALHRYYNKSRADSLYSIQRDDAAQSKAGYAYKGVAAYVYTAMVPGSTPLYRYWNPTNKRHLYLIEHYPSGLYGYKLKGSEGYLYKP